MSQQTHSRHPTTQTPPSIIEVREGWAAYLSALCWTHFVTLTSRHPVGAARLIREFRRMVHRIERMSKLGLRWFYVIEGSGEGRAHVHTLLWSESPLSNALVTSQWRMGITRVRRYTREWGAAYLAKELGMSRFDDYDISLRLPPAREGVSQGVGGSGRKSISRAPRYALERGGSAQANMKSSPSPSMGPSLP